MMMQQSDHQLFESSVWKELTLGVPNIPENLKRAEYYLSQFGLQSLKDQPAQFLSGGQKRILVILCMLMQSPDVIILDEPFSSLDTRSTETLVDILREYCATHTPAVIVCDQSHAALPRVCHVTLNISEDMK